MTVRILHNIGPRVNENYTPHDAVAGCSDRLTFDGVMLNVWQNRELLRGRSGTILFPIGNYIGGNNTFDAPMPFERFCDWNQIMQLVTDYGCELGWHTWSHPDLRQLDDVALRREVTPPFPMRHFSYPYGAFDERVINAVIEAGYLEAWAVGVGTDGVWQRLRSYL